LGVLFGGADKKRPNARRIVLNKRRIGSISDEIAWKENSIQLPFVSIVLHQRGLIGNSQNARKLFAACNTMHRIIPKRIRAKAKMKPEMICGKTTRGANSKVSAVNVVNRKLEMWSSPKAKQLT